MDPIDASILAAAVALFISVLAMLAWSDPVDDDE